MKIIKSLFKLIKATLIDLIVTFSALLICSIGNVCFIQSKAGIFTFLIIYVPILIGSYRALNRK